MPVEDLTYSVHQWTCQQKGYRLFSDYYRGRHELKFASRQFADQEAGKILTDQVMSIRENLCPAAVSAFTDGLAVTSWGSDQNDALAAQLGLPRLEALINRAGFRDGDAWCIVWEGPHGAPIPAYQPAAAMVPMVDETDPSVLAWAARVWAGRDNYGRVNLYYPDRVERWVTRSTVRASRTAQVSMPEHGSEWQPAPDGDIVPHGYGVVPVVWWKRDADDQLSGGHSILTDVIPLQDAMNKMIADLIVTSEDFSRPLMYLMNHKPQPTNPYLPADGTTPPSPTPKRRLFDRDRQQIFATDGPGPFGRLDPPDMTRLLEVQEAFAAKIARVIGVPSYWLLQSSGDLPSGASLRVLSTRRTSTIRDWQRDSTPSWRGLAELLGFQTPQISWSDPMPLSEEERVTIAVAKRRDLGYALADAIAGIGEADPEGIVERAAAERAADQEAAARAFMTGQTGL